MNYWVKWNISYYLVWLDRQPTRLSNPELSAFHEMTGIPKYPASWRKYWEAAVVRPKCSLIFYFVTTKKYSGSSWRKMMFLLATTNCQNSLSLSFPQISKLLFFKLLSKIWRSFKFLFKNICCSIFTYLSCRLLSSRCYPGKFRKDFWEWLKRYEIDLMLERTNM